MKKIFRFAGMGALLALFLAVGSTVGFAQDPCEDYDGFGALDAKIRGNYQSIKTLPTAIEAGKQYLEKYGSCDVTKDFVVWLKPLIPQWEKQVADKAKEEERSAILARYDAAVESSNWDAAYAAGNEFTSKFPNDEVLINVIIPLGQIGLLESAPPKKNFKYNSDTLRYSDMALAKLQNGIKSTKPSGEFGAFQFQGKREDVIGNLIYSKAYIKYWAQGNKKAGIEDYYQLTSLPGIQKSNPLVYETIGGYYYEDVTRIVDELKTLIEQLRTIEDEEARVAKDKEILAKEALLKGYAERAIDAYARAYSVTKNDAATKAYRDGLYNTLKGLYNVRFGRETGLDAYLATTTAKPMPNPTSDVDPINEVKETETPANTTTGSVSRP